ncbi:hypothetical protein ACFL5G_04155 [Candidatus Margulisiibacteriota bacterium]
MKKLLLCLVILCFALPVWSAGKLTVVTDLGNDAKIFIDGKQVGTDSIQGYPVEPGEHYVTVWYRGKKSYAKMLDIYEGEFKTISSAHFVDLKTKTASRGAIDVEAARLRESRGNMAFGLYGSSPASGLSWKWWFFEKLGVQAIGFLSSNGDQVSNQVGGRLLIHLADKVLNETTITAYLAAGGGTAYAKDGDKADTTLIGEGTLGIEMGFLSLYWSLELGVEKRVVTHTNDEEAKTDLSNMKASGGVHYYF